MVFLPPYSPEFNPIELMFSSMKAFFQRNTNLVREYWGPDSTSEQAATLLANMAETVGTVGNVAGWYRKCNYH